MNQLGSALQVPAMPSPVLQRLGRRRGQSSLSSGDQDSPNHHPLASCPAQRGGPPVKRRRSSLPGWTPAVSCRGDAWGGCEATAARRRPGHDRQAPTVSPAEGLVPSRRLRQVDSWRTWPSVAWMPVGGYRCRGRLMGWDFRQRPGRQWGAVGPIGTGRFQGAGEAEWGRQGARRELAQPATVAGEAQAPGSTSSGWEEPRRPRFPQARTGAFGWPVTAASWSEIAPARSRARCPGKPRWRGSPERHRQQGSR